MSSAAPASPPSGASPAGAVTVTHNAAARRFECTVEGLLCEATYHLDGAVMVMDHTGVPRVLEGRGIAAQLVRAALDHARAEGLKVRPLCSYVRVYMQRHRETLDLVA